MSITDDVVNALTLAGGIADIKLINLCVKETRDFSKTKTPDASISVALQSHSSDTVSYKGVRNDKNDLFFRVRRGVWGLRGHPFFGGNS